jgi:putative transposase
MGGTRPPVQTMISSIDDQRTVYGVESICRVLPIAYLTPDRRKRSNRRKGTYYAGLAVRAYPAKASRRCQQDIALKPKIRQVWDDNWKVYGVRKTSRQLRREGVDVARCTVARIMAGMGLRGVVQGNDIKTSFSETSMPCPRDKVKRRFRAAAPDILCPYGDASIAYRVTGQ